MSKLVFSIIHFESVIIIISLDHLYILTCDIFMKHVWIMKY